MYKSILREATILFVDPSLQRKINVDSLCVFHSCHSCAYDVYDTHSPTHGNLGFNSSSAAILWFQFITGLQMLRFYGRGRCCACWCDGGWGCSAIFRYRL